MSQHGRQIAAIRRLTLQGMKMINALAAEQAAVRRDLRDLAASQRKTDAQLQAFVKSLERGGNGHSGPPRSVVARVRQRRPGRRTVTASRGAGRAPAFRAPAPAGHPYDPYAAEAQTTAGC